MITFGSKLNRMYSIYMEFMNIYGNIEVYFHKHNPCVAIKLDDKLLQYIKEPNSNCWYHIYKDINESPFVKTFLSIQDKECESFDIKNQFFDIKSEYKDKVKYLGNECIKVGRIPTDNGYFESLLYVYTFTYNDHDNEFIFTIAERQHKDTITNKKVVRTCGLQLTTNNRLREILKVYNHDVSCKKINSINEIQI